MNNRDIRKKIKPMPLVEDTEHNQPILASSTYSSSVNDVPKVLVAKREPSSTQVKAQSISEPPQLSASVVDDGSHQLFQAGSSTTPVADGESYRGLIRNLIKSSAIYTLSSLASPIISLLLLPFLTRVLSHADYGALAVLDTLIALVSGVTTLGLDGIFARVYSYECQTRREQLDALSTLTLLLCLVLIPIVLIGVILAPWLATLVLGTSAYSRVIALAAVLVVLQNLTIPGLMWMRVENRAASYSVISIINFLLVCGATVVLVGRLHMGITGALIAMGVGNAIVTICTLPILFFRAGFHFRSIMVNSMLVLGAPYAMNYIVKWIIQLSDRYLLAHLASLSITANYSILYSLGTAASFVVTQPFAMAWWVLIYPIARRNDASLVFKMIFRWYGFVLLFTTLGVSLLGVNLLNLLFPASYHRQPAIISVVALSTVFNSIFTVFSLGMTLRRKTWVAFIAFLFSALLNIGANIVLIPLYGSMGAAIATLIAYIVLASIGYVVNQLIYPVPFEIRWFLVALGIGISLYFTDMSLTQGQSNTMTWIIHIVLLLVYGASLVCLGYLPDMKIKRNKGDHVMGSTAMLKKLSTRESYPGKKAIKVCMHLLGSARLDARVMRDATALMEAGFAVTIVDVEDDYTRSAEEDLNGVHLKHIFMPGFFIPTRFKPWFLVKLVKVTIYSVMQLLRVQADIYHAHVERALPACFIVARLRGKPFIVDTPELTLSDPRIRRWPLLRGLAIRIIRYIVSYSSGYITASPLFAQEIGKLYHINEVTVIRNVPPYQTLSKSDRLRQYLGLGPEIKIILYQGGIQPNRSLDKLIHAAAFLKPDIVIVIMGSDLDGTQASLEAIIKRECLTDRIKIIPAVPYAELLEWTHSADIGLIVLSPDYSLTIRMCLPNKLYEYIMAGIPILATSLDAVSDVIRTYDIGYIVSSLEPTDISSAIHTMLDDREALQRMSRNALEAARSEFYWEKESQKLICLYQSILAKLAVKR